MTLVQESVRPTFAHRVSLLGTENAFKIAPWIREVEQAGHRVIRCNIGEPDFPLPEHIAEEVKRRIDAGETHYVDPQGIEPLRIAIAKTASERRGIDITPDRVVVFPGAKPPIGFAQQIYCDPGDQVIYPSPGFPIYESFTRFVDAVPMPLHLREETGFSLTAEDLEPLLTPRTKLIYLNFPSNPTGGVATREQLEGIAQLILDMAPPDVRIYSDEVYEDILFDGAKHESIASIPGMAARTIIVGGVSKSYAWTGGRVGWAILPTAEEAALFRTFNINYFSCVPAYNQWGAKVALESPESAIAIAKMNAEFQRRRDFVVDSLNAIPGIRCQKPRGAFYVFPNIGDVTRDASQFQRRLLFTHHVATLDRRSFGVIGSEGKQYLRLSIATSMRDLEEAMRRIRVCAAEGAFE
ncbi:MAG: pyridoxal phosphate-dependent aminotransferase [Thermoanaerobaculia bacterium]